MYDIRNQNPTLDIIPKKGNSPPYAPNIYPSKAGNCGNIQTKQTYPPPQKKTIVDNDGQQNKSCIVQWITIIALFFGISK